MSNRRSLKEPVTTRELKKMSPLEKREIVDEQLLSADEPVKAPAKKSEATKAASKKETLKKEAPAKMETVKKEAPAKNKTRSKKEAAKKETVSKGYKQEIVLQDKGADFKLSDITDSVRGSVKAKKGKGEIKIYIKLEERRAYYVADGVPDGSYIEF